ncbi:hypothetical protein DCC62_29265 [candidate division KSB1 bacterium]|nr:MAG: hypothetical protein DCC62_29265 [candidate division KSB1 bacterium]
MKFLLPKNMGPRLSYDYCIFGVKVTVRSTAKRVQDHIGSFLGKCQDSKISTSPNMQVSFDLHSDEYFPQKPTIPKSAVLISLPELPVKVYKACREFYLVFNESWLHLSLAKLHGIGVFDKKIWHHPGAAENFFFSGICLLLHQCGLYRLHASGIVFQEKGFLFIGKSGAGKSTLALTLVKQGWKYLNDDILFLRLLDSRVEALAIPIEFKTDDRIFHKLFTKAEQDFAFKLPQCQGLPYYHKYYIRMDRLYPERFSRRCLPKFLLFTEVISDTTSKLEIIDQHQALKRLIEASLVFVFDDKSAHNHLAALGTLVQQTTVYRLYAGQDILNDPDTFEKFLLDNTYRLEK